MNQVAEFFVKLFDSSDWPPRWHCGQWTAFHGWLYIISDLLIWSAYFSIPIFILRFISKKQDIRFVRLYFLFAAFILACGATHLLDAIAFWVPLYRLNALVRFITGVISWVTVFYLIKYLPVLFSLKPQNALEEEIQLRKRSEEKFKGILEAAPDAIVIANEKGEITLINRQTEKLFGYSKDELIGRRVEVLIPVDFRDKHVSHRTQYIEAPKVRSMGAGLELFAVRKDGTQFPVEISLSPLVTEEGTLISASVRDITDRKRSEEKFKGLLEAAPDAMVIANEKGEITLINRQTEKLFGYSKEELIGKPVEVLIPVDFRNKHVSHRTQYIEAPKVRSMGAGLELFAIRKDGTQFPVEISLSPLITEEGTLISASVRDITERKKVEERVRFLASIADNIQDPVISTDNAGGNNFIITRWNESAEKLLEWKSEEVIGKNAMEIFKTDYPYETREQIFELLKAKGFWQGEIIYHTKSGKPVYVLSTISYLKDVQGNISGNLVLIRDISKRKKAEEALSKLNEELEAFSYSVSHDLRAPLRGIIGFANILEEDYTTKLDDEAKRITAIIKKNTTKMGQLIDDLLTFSRMGRQELIKGAVNSNKIVQGIIYDFDTSENHIKIEWNIHSLPLINADISTINQVWINLISNAVKYSRNAAQPKIEIGSIEENGDVTFFVKDNGVGFDEKYKAKLFKVFQRLHTTEEFEGTGIGLAIVEKIVSKHGGKVWAEGELNKGATFYFSLPVDKDQITNKN